MRNYYCDLYNVVQYNLYKWGARDGEYPDTPHTPVIISLKKG